MSIGDRWPSPPVAVHRGGAERKVGVELEFANLAPRRAAGAVRDLFGGEIFMRTPHVVEVRGGRLGDFVVELDMALARREVPSGLEADLRDAVAGAASLVAPSEIVCPPLPWDRAHEMDALPPALRALGAEGTRDGLLYAFGLQLNIEPPDLSVDTLLATLRAYVLLSPWLRAQIDVDTLRHICSFETSFSEAYAKRLLDRDYKPDMNEFIDDYLRYNPSRDRELDLLPMLCWIDPDRVRARLPREKINRRPTWHWRLPNSELSNPEWSIGEEWRRWLAVERLAGNRRLLRRAARLWRRQNERLIGDDWPVYAARLAERLA